MLAAADERVEPGAISSVSEIEGKEHAKGALRYLDMVRLMKEMLLPDYQFAVADLKPDIAVKEPEKTTTPP